MVSQAVPDQGTHVRILLVEDEPTSRAILSAYLTDSGYLVDEAENGAVAWDMLSKNANYTMVVTDKIMPVMDGLTLALRMKQDPQLRDIPVIMQTSATTQADVLQGVKAGVFYYLAKPYEEATLKAIVRAAANERKKSNLFERRLSSQQQALGTFVNGEFLIRTPEEAANIAVLLGSAFPRPELAVSGLNELLLNAIEHGNLGLGYETKNQLLATGKWEEEIKHRLNLPENRSKKTVVRFAQNDNEINVTIRDEGPGFDWRPFMQIEPSRATQGSGRGIAKANLLSFDSLEFQGKGNEVTLKSAKK